MYGDRLETLAKEFEAAGATLTTNIWILGSRRFLRSEIDEYLSIIVKNAQGRDNHR